jgi:hypothetical protein
MSPHACSSLDVFRIVAAKETLYWSLLLPVAAPPVDTKIRLQLTIVEREMNDRARQLPHQALSWEGTLLNASSEARKLFGK